MPLFWPTLLLLLCCGARAELWVGVSPSLVSRVGEEACALVSASVSALHPPDVHQRTSKADVTLSNFRLSLRMSSVRLGAPSSLQVLYFSSGDTFNYHVRQRSFPHVAESGTILVLTPNDNHRSVSMGAALSFASPGAPSVTLALPTFEVEAGDLIVYGHCTNSVCLIPVSDIVGPLAKGLLPAVSAAVQKEGQAAANAALSHLHDIVQLPFGLSFDLEGALSVTPGGSVRVQSHGAFLAGSKRAPFTPEPIAPPEFSSRDVDIFLSPFVLRSLVWAAFEEGMFSATITNAATAGLPFHLEASNAFFLQAVPALANYTGLNLTMATSMPAAPLAQNVHISPSTGVTLGPLDLLLSFSLVNNTAPVVQGAFVLRLSLTVSLNATLEHANNTLSVMTSIVNHNASVSVVSSKLGTVSASAFDTILKFAFALAKPPPLHLRIPAALAVTSAALNIVPNYIHIGVDGDYKLPAPASSPRAPLVPRSHVQFPSYPLVAPQSSSGVQLCGNGTASCAAGKTCCAHDAQMSSFGCCPSAHATCCSDRKHCCPAGSLCSDSSSKCVKLN